MFYSHEILTQRKYGVATIWLVATLGSKSNLKKVHRKDILGVNVPKACATVIQPGAPLALRLQSNLLYGISRVYSGQCDYLISDASMAHANIKRLITTTVKAANLDLSSGGRARPENLILADDPAFLPDLNLTQLPDGIDLIMDEGGARFTLGDSLGVSSLNLDKASSVYSLGHIGSRADSSPAALRPDLMIATSETMAGDYGFLPGPSSAGNDRFFDDVDFEFDADGEMKELTPKIPMPPRDPMVGIRADSTGLSGMRRAGGVQGIGRGNRMNSEEAAAQVLREHEEGRDGSYSRIHALGDDGDLYAPPEDNLFDLLDGTEPLPDRTQGSPEPKGLSADSRTENLEVEAEAPTRRKRGPRATVVIIDTKTELRNSDLKEWRDNYLINMEAALKRSQARKASRKAKNNANTLVFEFGFFGQLRNPMLKSLFSAKALLETINEASDERAAEGDKKRKRTKTPGVDGGTQGGLNGEGEEGRRVRVRTEEGLGDDLEIGLSNLADEYELPMGQRDDLDQGETEIGREGPEEMSEGIRPSSQAALPWNIMSSHINRSRAGSLMSGGIMLPSVGGFLSSSVGGSQIGQMDFGSRRGSRLSAIRSGMERLSVMGLPIGERDEEGLEDLDQEFPAEGDEMEFEYFGAGANVDTQTAQDSQWLAATVEQESTNFFEFLKTEHAKQKQQVEDEGEEPAPFITFEKLLNPAQNGRIVAAQAFHHTLLLATKGLVYVSQEEKYGTIQISIL